MATIKKGTKNVTKFFLSIFLELLPFLTLFYVCWGYLGNFSKAEPTTDQYKVLFTAIGFAVTLSSLSFSASNNANSEQVKDAYRLAATKFLRAVLLLILATTLCYTSYKYFYDALFLPTSFMHAWPFIISFGKNIIKLSTTLLTPIFLYRGLIEAIHGIELLYDMLKKNQPEEAGKSIPKGGT